MGSALLSARHAVSRQRRATQLALAACLCSAATFAVVVPANAGPCDKPAPGAASLSCQTVPATPKQDVDDQVVHAYGPHVYPEKVRVRGDSSEVVNPHGVRRKGGGVATLTTSGQHTSSLVIDLGRLTMGNVELGIKSASGAKIRVAHSQFRQFLSTEGDDVCCSFGTDDDPETRVDIFDPPSGETVLRTPGKRETRYLLVTLDGPGTVTIDFVRTAQTIYPIKYDGYFQSSDRLLNRAWYNSAYTGDLSSMRQAGSPWMLTVTFDRVLFMGDLHVQALAGYNQSSDYWMLMRNTLNQFGCVQNPDGSLPMASSTLVTCKKGNPGPPDGWRVPEEGPDPKIALGYARRFSLYYDIPIDSFTAFWVASLADYYRYTGDAKFVKPLLPVARRALGFLTKRSTPEGLYYEPADEFVFRSNWHPGDTASGVDSFSNAAYIDATKGVALLERSIAKRPAAARKYEALAEKVRKALIKSHWDTEADAMILNTDDPRKDHTGDANAGNLMFQTLDRKRARDAMQFLSKSLSTPWGTRSSEYTDNPYMQSYIHGYINTQESLGRVRYGDGRGALELIRRWWGHMLRVGPGTGWFTANNDGTVERGSFSNTGWTTALPALSEALVAVKPTAPGFKRWLVAPQPSGLRWAQGRVPVPGGGISVRWKRLDRGFVMTVAAPKQGKTGEVRVPIGKRARAVAMDGKVVWRPDGGAVRGVQAKRKGNAIAISGVSGAHTFAWGRGR